MRPASRLTRRGAALGLCVVLVSTAAGCGGKAVDTSAIGRSSGGDLLCGALPRAAVVKAVGTSDIRVKQGRDGLDTMRSSDSAACFVDTKSRGRRVLDVVFSDASGPDNRLALKQFAEGHSDAFSTLPRDLGTGILIAPYSKDSPSAQITMMSGQNQLSILLQRAPEERNQREDVVVLARLLKPYFPSAYAPSHSPQAAFHPSTELAGRVSGPT